MSLTASDRKRIPDKRFGLPKQRKYPLDAIGRARNALSRAAQFASSGEQAKIRRKVHDLYRSIHVSK